MAADEIGHHGRDAAVGNEGNIGSYHLVEHFGRQMHQRAVATIPVCPISQPSRRPACRTSSRRAGSAFVAPAGTPVDVIAKLNAAFVTVLKDPDIVERIRALGSEPIPMTSAEFTAFIEVEIKKWLKVAAASNFKPNYAANLQSRKRKFFGVRERSGECRHKITTASPV